mmetsp:Transcript_11242/g.21223  ORF Transcript_11242/g.21223 Transcript_11242/m.21223 type:complete len:234 (-) Transcript_11242:166-867(-)
MSIAIEIEKNGMADSCSHSQLQAFLLTATVAAATGKVTADPALPPPEKSEVKCDEFSEAETETTADAGVADSADSSASSDTESEDVDIGSWREVGSRLASLLSYEHSDEQWPPPALKASGAHGEACNTMVAFQHRGKLYNKVRPMAGSAVPCGLASLAASAHDIKDVADDRETIDVNKWRMVGTRVAHAFAVAREEEEAEEEDESDEDLVDVKKWQLLGSRVSSALAAADVED